MAIVVCWICYCSIYTYTFLSFICLKTGSCSSQKYFIDVNESLSILFLSECLGLCQVISVLHSRLHNAVKTHQAVLKQLCEHIGLCTESYFVPLTVIWQHTYILYLKCCQVKPSCTVGAWRQVFSVLAVSVHCSCHGMVWQIFFILPFPLICQ